VRPPCLCKRAAPALYVAEDAHSERDPGAAHAALFYSSCRGRRNAQHLLLWARLQRALPQQCIAWWRRGSSEPGWKACLSRSRGCVRRVVRAGPSHHHIANTPLSSQLSAFQVSDLADKKKVTL
ncbi:hypothetical protein MNV84_02784, partial [Leishmania braziliensis]